MTTAKRVRRVPTSEVFGPVIQGEGPLAGVATSFIRVAGCDYRCSWCDTPYAVLPELWARTADRLDPVELADRAAKLGTEWVTLSGGNPAIYDLSDTVNELHLRGNLVSIETQGSVCPEWLRDIDQIVVSPKPPSSGMTQAADDFRQFAPALATLLAEGDPDDGHLARRPAIKVVVFSDDDFLWALDTYGEVWGQHFPGTPLYLSVGTDPPREAEHLADTRAGVCDRMAWVMDRVARYGGPIPLRVGPQLHVLAYGHARGV